MASIAIDDVFLAMSALCRSVQFVDVGCCAHDGVDEVRGCINIDLAAHRISEAFCEAVEPLVAPLGLVHLRVSLASFVFGGTGHCDQGIIHERALAHRHAVRRQLDRRVVMPCSLR